MIKLFIIFFYVFFINEKRIKRIPKDYSKINKEIEIATKIRKNKEWIEN